MNISNQSVIKNINLINEIESISEILKNHGFTFMDLHKCSPKTEKDRYCCAKAINHILNDKLFLNYVKTSSDIPCDLLCEVLGIPRKFFKKYRKYIIAAIEIFNGDYPYLTGYLKFIQKV